MLFVPAGLGGTTLYRYAPQVRGPHQQQDRPKAPKGKRSATGTVSTFRKTASSSDKSAESSFSRFGTVYYSAQTSVVHMPLLVVIVQTVPAAISLFVGAPAKLGFLALAMVVFMLGTVVASSAVAAFLVKHPSRGLRKYFWLVEKAWNKLPTWRTWSPRLNAHERSGIVSALRPAWRTALVASIMSYVPILNELFLSVACAAEAMREDSHTVDDHDPEEHLLGTLFLSSNAAAHANLCTLAPSAATFSPNASLWTTAHQIIFLSMMLFTTLLVSLVSWNSAFTGVALRTQLAQQEQSLAMLRWLSHECRSPVAAAMLTLDYLMGDCLPPIQHALFGASGDSASTLSVTRGSTSEEAELDKQAQHLKSALHAHDHAAPFVSARDPAEPDRHQFGTHHDGQGQCHAAHAGCSASGGTKRAGEQASCLVSLDTVDPAAGLLAPLFSPLLQNNPQADKLRTAAASVRAEMRDLRDSMGLVMQPLKSLSDVLDNMLLYMRRQREQESDALSMEGSSSAATAFSAVAPMRLHTAWVSAWQNATANHDVEGRGRDVQLSLTFQNNVQGLPQLGYGRQRHGEAALAAMSNVTLFSSVMQPSLLQVLTNYVTNALKYGRNDKGSVSMRVSFTLAPVSTGLSTGGESPKVASMAQPQHSAPHAQRTAQVVPIAPAARHPPGGAPHITIRGHTGHSDKGTDGVSGAAHVHRPRSSSSQQRRPGMGSAMHKAHSSSPRAQEFKKSSSVEPPHTRKTAPPSPDLAVLTQMPIQSAYPDSTDAFMAVADSRRVDTEGAGSSVPPPQTGTRGPLQAAPEASSTNTDYSRFSLDDHIAFMVNGVHMPPAVVRQDSHAQASDSSAEGRRQAGTNSGDGSASAEHTSESASTTSSSGTALDPTRFFAKEDIRRALREVCGVTHRWGRSVEVAPKSCPAGLTPDGATQGLLLVTVRDEGQGMSAEELEQLFQPFARLRSGASAKGNGLGLWLMKELIESQGGALAVHSAGLGKGCTFMVLVPIMLQVEPGVTPPEGASEAPLGTEARRSHTDQPTAVHSVNDTSGHRLFRLHSHGHPAQNAIRVQSGAQWGSSSDSKGGPVPGVPPGVEDTGELQEGELYQGSVSNNFPAAPITGSTPDGVQGGGGGEGGSPVFQSRAPQFAYSLESKALHGGGGHAAPSRATDSPGPASVLRLDDVTDSSVASGGGGAPSMQGGQEGQPMHAVHIHSSSSAGVPKHTPPVAGTNRSQRCLRPFKLSINGLPSASGHSNSDSIGSNRQPSMGASGSRMLSSLEGGAAGVGGGSAMVKTPRGAHAKPARGSISTGISSGGTKSGLHVLVVDDAPTNRIMLARQLRRKGHTVQVAEDGVEGLRLFLETQVAAGGVDSDTISELSDEERVPVIRPRGFDLVISDMTMPNMNGDEMVRMMLSACEEHGLPVPAIIGVTGNALVEDQGVFTDAGAHAVLVKPVQLKTILDVAKRYLSHPEA